MITQLEKKLTGFFVKKVPAMPEKIKKIIVKYGPYVAIVALVIAIPVTLGMIGLMLLSTPLVWITEIKGWENIIAIILGIIMIWLQIKAIPGLFEKKIEAWRLMFYMSLLSALSNLISLDFWSLIIGTGLAWYILFQIKSEYR